jgi:hypothetical protein
MTLNPCNSAAHARRWLHTAHLRAVRWKTYDWGITERLFEQGLVYDPRGKAESVVSTPEGEVMPRLRVKHFSMPESER